MDPISAALMAILDAAGSAGSSVAAGAGDLAAGAGDMASKAGSSIGSLFGQSAPAAAGDPALSGATAAAQGGTAASATPSSPSLWQQAKDGLGIKSPIGTLMSAATLAKPAQPQFSGGFSGPGSIHPNSLAPHNPVQQIATAQAGNRAGRMPTLGELLAGGPSGKGAGYPRGVA